MLTKVHLILEIWWCSYGVSITNLTIVYSTVYSVADQRKHQSSASLAFVRGIHGFNHIISQVKHQSWLFCLASKFGGFDMLYLFTHLSWSLFCSQVWGPWYINAWKYSINEQSFMTSEHVLPPVQVSESVCCTAVISFSNQYRKLWGNVTSFVSFFAIQCETNHSNFIIL